MKESKGKIWFTKGIAEIAFLGIITSVFFFAFEQKVDCGNHHLVFELQPDIQYQAIHNFGASDAWACQFVGEFWPEESKKAISQLLFSNETDIHGNPLGIGLSAWRFNIGGGSAEQGEGSKIKDEWRRSECFIDNDGTYDWSKQKGQQWFLKEAADYGVKDLIGFVNSPPIHFTKNNKAFSEDGLSTNLIRDHYKDYVDFIIEVIKNLELVNGTALNYISPFNEPQWEWKCCKQEGSPWNNNEIYDFTRLLDSTFHDYELNNVKIDIPETAQIDFLYDDQKKPVLRNDQINAFFNPESPYYVGDLDYVAKKVCAHSYFSTWPVARRHESRQLLQQKIKDADPNLEYWMTEYCILEDNQEIKGGGIDLGMSAALYMAGVIHSDLTIANACAWQWWLAISPYNYKDGLVHIEKKQYGGDFYPTKMLWALGNYSRFIKPGSKRIAISAMSMDPALLEKFGIFFSAYEVDGNEIVVVITNRSDKKIEVSFDGLPNDLKGVNEYITSDLPDDNLRLRNSGNKYEKLIVPEESIITCVFQNLKE